MAYRSTNFVGIDADTVIGSADALHPNNLSDYISNHKNNPSFRPSMVLSLQHTFPDFVFHDSREKIPQTRSLMYSNAGRQQQNYNPNRTDSVPTWNVADWSFTQPNEPNFPQNAQRAMFVAETPLEDPVSSPLRPKPPHAALLKPNHFARLELCDLFVRQDCPSPYPFNPPPRSVDLFRREISKTLPIPWTAKRLAAATSDGDQSQKRTKTRISLPLTLNANSGPATVLACPDTGSEENIISLGLAQALGYNILTSPSQNRTFALANGSIVEAVGEIIAECSFGLETTPAAVPMTLVFYVFMKLASPIIMGLAFLEQTRTLSDHRYRLLRVPRLAHQPIQVYSVGKLRNQLCCYLDYSFEVVMPDSGSEINLMTRSFANSRVLHIKKAKEVVEFADGTIAVVSGVVRAHLQINKSRNYTSGGYRTNPTADFYIMDDLRHDVIVGEDSLEELEVFTKEQQALLFSPYAVGPAGLNLIRPLGAIDEVLSWLKKKICLIRRSHAPSISTQVLPNDSLADQRENDRREREEVRIVNLPVDQQEGAIAAEALKQAQYGNTAG